MGDWRLTRQTDEFRELLNISTGQIKKVKMASDKQWAYLNSLRADVKKIPIKNRPTVFAASKAIDKLLSKAHQTSLL